MQAVAERCNYHSVEDLLAGLGYGEVTLNLVPNRWREVVKAQQPIATDSEVPPPIPTPSPLPTRAQMNRRLGVEGLLYYIAGCCSPIPGEDYWCCDAQQSGNFTTAGVRTWRMWRAIAVSQNSTHT